jgi:hypothetical protein
MTTLQCFITERQSVGHKSALTLSGHRLCIGPAIQHGYDVVAMPRWSDAKLEAEGKAEGTAGKIQNAVGGLKDALRGK